MAFFEDFGKKISQASQATIQKTKEMTEIVKLNSAVSDEEKKITNAYSQIGKLYVELHAEDYEEAFRDIFMEMNAANIRIEELKEEILKVRGVKVCTNCGGEVADTAEFCPSCGTKLPAPVKAEEVLANIEEISVVEDSKLETTVNAETPAVEEAAETTTAEAVIEKKFCKQCGMELKSDAMFCAQCGTKVE